VSRTLKRPMFRRGGTVNDGIMTGLEDREKLQAGTRDPSAIAKSVRENIEQFEPILRDFTPKTRLPLGQVGFALASGVDPLQALGAGYSQFVKADDAREAAIKRSAASMGFSQALKNRNQSVLAAEKEARFLLPENATPAEIRAKTAELLEKKYTGVTYGPEAEYSRLKSDFFKLYQDEDQAQRHADFVTKVKPKLPDGEISRGRISKDKKGNYKPRKGPGVYVDTLDAKVILFKDGQFTELPELSALLR